MKKILGNQALKLLVVLILAVFSLGFLGVSADTGVIVDEVTVEESFLVKNFNISKDLIIKKMEAKKKEEEERKKTSFVTVNKVNNSYQVPVVSGDSIRIGNVLNKNLKKDYNGDNFYLNHNVNGVYDGIGVPYIDFRTDFNTRKTIIYAHSSTSGNGPFQVLQNYHYNKGFYNNNRYITINYNGSTYTYLIFSVYVSVADSEESEGLEYFQNMDYSDEEWEAALNRYKSHSEYDTGVSVNSNDKILILQTCSMDSNYYNKYYRYNLLIMGKLV